MWLQATLACFQLARLRRPFPCHFSPPCRSCRPRIGAAFVICNSRDSSLTIVNAMTSWVCKSRYEENTSFAPGREAKTTTSPRKHLPLSRALVRMLGDHGTRETCNRSVPER
jgi:hypothetical protein